MKHVQCILYIQGVGQKKKQLCNLVQSNGGLISTTLGKIIIEHSAGQLLQTALFCRYIIL